MGGLAERFAVVTVFSSIVVLFAASSSVAALGDCAQPVSAGGQPVATDCLYILRAAVGSETCEPACVCDPAGGGGVAATDALACLRVATGLPQALECNCPATTTTTSTVPTTTLPPTTTTTLTVTTSSTSTTSTTSTSSTSSSTTTSTIVTCDSGGVSFEGSCWYIAATNAISCDTVCGTFEKACDEAATRDVAGSGASLEACVYLAGELFGTPTITEDSDNTPCGSADLGVGCIAFEHFALPGDIFAYRITAPVTTCAADGDGGSCLSAGRRICACD
jgi:hypothetical protein